MPTMFSVVIPTYNRAEKLLRSLQSVMLEAAAYAVEIIVIDDGSTDGTHESLSALIATNQIRYISHHTNLGVCAARNTGIANAKGDLLIFLDSDDVLLPNSLKYISDFFERCPETDILFGGTVTFGNVPMCWVKNSPAHLDFRQILEGGAAGEFCAICRPRVFKRFLFDEALNGFEGITWMQIAQAGYKLYYDEYPLRKGEFDSDGLSGYTALTENPMRFAKGYLAQLKVMGSYVRDSFGHIYDQWLLKSVLYHRLAGSNVSEIIQTYPAVLRATQFYINFVRLAPLWLLRLALKIKVRLQIRQR